MPDVSTPDLDDLNRRRALNALLDRRSVGALDEPAPRDFEIDLIVDAGLRAPDHGKLRPWRFVLIRGEARRAFGAALVAAAARRDQATPQSLLDRYQAWATRTPLLIGVGTKMSARHFIPEIEQVLSAGAAAMNMLNAIHLLGYGGMWVTGPNSYDPAVNALLGFRAPDRLVGLLAVGTPRTTAPVERPARAAHLTEWTGPSVVEPTA
ncbi:MAG: nitroreductase [Proteobacteria bacterium]|nr:nitroreductase [Pseudomonadota bacterium]